MTCRTHASSRVAGRLTLATIAAAACLVLPGFAAEQNPAPWPEITEHDRGLTSVPQDPEAHAVILIHSRVGKIVTQGKYYVNVLDYHWRLKVLTEQGKRYAEVHVPSYKYSQVEGIEARSIKPDGTVMPVAADQIFEKLVQKGRGYKVVEHVFNFPAVEPGSILEYRYRRTRADLFGILYIEPWDFAGPEITLLSRVTQSFPSDASYRILCNNCPNPEPATESWVDGRTSGKRIALEMKNVPAYREELMMPPQAEVSPRMEMVLVAWNYVAWAPLKRMDKLFTDWTSVGQFARFYYQIVSRLDEVALKKAVASWTKGIMDPNDRTKAVFRHVQEDFRSIPSDDVYGQTSSIESMLKAKAADNEDKAVLLMAALRSMGVRANLALVAGRRKGRLNTAYPSLSQFSHVLVALPQPDGSALWLDPTVAYAPFGFMPSQDSGAAALYIPDEGSVLINLPIKLEPNGTRYDITARPVAGGTTDLDVVAEYQGEDAIEMRQELVPAAESARTTFLEGWLREARPGASLQSHEIENLESLDKPLRIRMKIEAPGLVSRADDLLLVRTCVLECRDVNPMAAQERRHPFYVDLDWNEKETVTIVPPAGMRAAQPPASAAAKSVIGALLFSCTSQPDGAVRCERLLIVPRNHWPADKGAVIRAMFDRIVEIDRTAVVLQPVEEGSAGR